MQVNIEKEWRNLLGSQAQRQVFKGLVPSKVGLKNVQCQKLGGAGNSQKIVFRNLEQALEDPSNDNLTRMKNALLQWCRQFGEARMSQGNDISTFEVIVTQRVQEAKAPAPELNRYEPFSTRKASIISRAVIGKK